MFTYYAIVVIISLFYFFIISSFIIGWNRIKTYQRGKQSPSALFLSIIIPVRNEENKISTLIHSLTCQTLDKNLFELIFVNDHSTDNTKQLLINEVSSKKNLHIIDLAHKQGKKNAIISGISNAKGELIVTTDADCEHHSNWLKNIYLFYSEYKPKMIICPVLMRGNSFFENIQSLDFLSLIASGAGACGINHPIMCNGANLAYEKKVFEEFTDPLNNQFVSGEDVFLLHQVKKKYPDKILFLKSLDAVVITKPEERFIQFLNQRKRWASKSKGYNDKDTILTAITVLLMNFSLLINLIVLIVYFNILCILIFQISLKFIPDLILLYKTTKFYNQKKLLRFFVPTQFFNIIFIPFVAITGMIGKVKWKSIKYK